MRLSLATLLFTTLALSLFGEEVDRPGLRNSLLSTLQSLQQQDVALINAALSADLSVDPQLLEHLRTLQANLTKQVVALKDPASDVSAARSAQDAAGVQLNMLGQLIGQFQTFAEPLRRFPHANDVPQAKELRQLRQERLAVIMQKMVTGESPPTDTPLISLRHQRLEMVLNLVESEHTAEVDRPHLQLAQPPLSDFTAWCRRARSETVAELGQPVADNPEELERHIERGRNAVNQRLRLLYAWFNRLDMEERLRSFQQPATGSDGIALETLRSTLVRQIELARERQRLLELPSPLDDQTQMRLDGIEREMEPLTAACERAEHAMMLQAQLSTSRTSITEQVAMCTEKVRKDLITRLDRLADDHGKALARQLKAAASGDRVDTIEADGDLRLVAIQLEILQEEAGSEAEMAGSEAAWRGQEQSPSLRELGKRYQDARERLSKARAKQTKAKIAVQLVSNRIALLQLKEELTNSQINEADELHNQAREELEQLNQALIQAATEAADGRRAKDAKDAERIPLKAGADNF